MFNSKIISSVIKITTNKLYVYPGGTIAPLLHECKLDKVELFVSKSEQGAGYMAIAEALSTHNPAFVTVTSGPGATNIITCIADAYYDSIPLIILTGQIGTADLARSKKLRQRGFQEVPIANMVKDITKKVFQPKNVQELSDAIHAAYQISNSNRKGPVLIDMPMDVQLGLLEKNELEKYLNFDGLSTKNSSYDIDENLIEESISLLNKAEKPLVLVGAGAQEDYTKIREFVENSSIPVISSLRGIGIISDENYKGWIGHTGMPWANKSLYEADTILVLGSRLDVRQTGTQTNVLDDKILIHVDVDELELEECRIKNTIKINMPIDSYLEHIMKMVNISDISPWLNVIDKTKQENKFDDIGLSQGLNPEGILSLVNELTEDKKTYITTGVGSHQHWSARYFNFNNDKKKLFTSAGHGTMGFSLPVAIGLQNLEQDTQVICIDGDGSFQMNIQELALIKELNLNLKILLLNNNRLGIVSQFQNITFKSDPTTGDFVTPDFIKIASAYGLKTYSLEQMDSEIVKDWLNCPHAALLHVQIKHDAPISPMLLGGQELNDMWYYNE